MAKTAEARAAEEARRRHPLNHQVDDPFGATGVAQSDEYGYEETARRAFEEGAAWQRAQTPLPPDSLEPPEGLCGVGGCVYTPHPDLPLGNLPVAPGASRHSWEQV